MQKILINYLGPIKKLEMEIRDFNLLVGEQATGKSTIAKSIYFFRSIKATLQDYFCQLYNTSLYNGHAVDNGFNKVLKKELKTVFVSLFGYSWDLDKHLCLQYEYTDEIWIRVKLHGKPFRKYINVQYSYKLTEELGKMETDVLNLYSQKGQTMHLSLADASRERLRNYGYLKKRLNRIFNDDKDTYYIPAGRSLLTLLANNRSLIESDNLDLITRHYMQIIDNIRSVFDDGIRNAHKKYLDGERRFDVNKIADMLIADLKGDYQYTSGREYIIIQDEERNKRKIPINFVSSGQQEVLWLLNQLYVLMLKKENAFVIIEEPEAHLYPKLQHKVVEFIAYFTTINNSAVLIMTHSPYILKAVNALRDMDKITALKIDKDKTIISLMNNELKDISLELIEK